ncbi:condensation domain-containing protein [Streptosporangium sp. NBC_01495]|uniref:condensation domain-containing protein n=1 Tax=Streptosporangium sp. NBC_01495 TaxID=2903899 RepID=UPI002E32BB99|nr:condensation domain-containing protein [Streptosporangium sp. NBC_01495]
MTGLPVRTAPLSYLQEQLWFVEQDDPGNGSYNELKVLVLDGALDAARLGRALDQVVTRHDVLRTTFVYQGAEPVQAVWDRGPVLREAAVGGEQALMEYAREVAEAPYDLASGPLLRASLVTLGAGRQALVLGVHHIISDGFSMNLLLDELDAAYRGELPGGPRGVSQGGSPGESRPGSRDESWSGSHDAPQSGPRDESPGGEPPGGEPSGEAPAQYGDFARWQREQFAGGRLAADVDHWRRELDGAPTVLELPADRPRPRRRASAGRRERFPLDPGLTGPLGEVAERVGGTVFTVLLAAFAATLYRYTGRGDMVLGTGAPGRPGREFDGALGFFANIVPVRLRPAGETPFTDLADAVSEAAFDAFDHQYVPFEKLVEFLQPERDAGHTPLVQVVFTMWDAGAAERSIGGVPAAEVEVTRGRSRFDVAVEAVRRGDRVDLFVEYDDALFDEATIARVMRHYDRVLRAVADDPAQPLADIPMITPEERATLTQGDMTVLDHDGNVLPAGAVGQLVRRSGEGGAGPTGRLAIRRPDGRVVERGREDRLVGIGPFQVQLEDVEEVLRAHPAVRDAAVVAVEGGAGRELVAYTVAGPPPDALRATLVERLPQYMVPAVIVPVDHIPRAEDGRVETGRLPDAGERDERTELPALEAALCVIWARVMNLDEVEPDDDFFALGGHSMLAARLVREIASVLAVRVPLMALFENCTPADLADHMAAKHPALEHTLGDAGRAGRAGRTVPAGKAWEAGEIERDGEEPDTSALSTAQLQIWINEQLAGGDARDFIAAVTYRVRGPLDVAALRGAFDALVARHENLRARVALVGDVPVLRFDPGVRVELPVTDLTGLPGDERVREAARRTARDADRGFDLSTAPLVRAVLYRLGEDDHVLALVQHHLVTDGVSIGLLVGELGRLYSERDAAPAAPHLRFADYVAWEQAWLGGPEAAASERFWRERLREAPELVLPRTRDGRREGRDTEMIAHRLPHAESRRLLALARQSRATPYMLVTAAFAAMLAQWGGQDDVVIGTTADNRPLPGLEGVVGCFVNMVALRVDCGGDPTFAELTGRVRRTVLEAYAHQSTPFNEVVRALRIHPDPRRMPLFQVTSDWAGDGPAIPELAGCEVGFDYVHTRANRYELEMYAGMAGERVVLDLEYAVELWDRKEVEERLERVAALLTRAVVEPETRISELLG